MHLARVLEAGGRGSGSAVKQRVGAEPAPTPFAGPCIERHPVARNRPGLTLQPPDLPDILTVIQNAYNEANELPFADGFRLLVSVRNQEVTCPWRQHTLHANGTENPSDAESRLQGVHLTGGFRDKRHAITGGARRPSRRPLCSGCWPPPDGTSSTSHR